MICAGIGSAVTSRVDELGLDEHEERERGIDVAVVADADVIMVGVAPDEAKDHLGRGVGSETSQNARRSGCTARHAAAMSSDNHGCVRLIDARGFAS